MTIARNIDGQCLDGTRRDHGKGYVKVRNPGHPNAYRNGWVLEHRMVLADVIGRRLEDYESPHHKNGLRHDNRPENLELWDVSQPSGQRVCDKLMYYQDLLTRNALNMVEVLDVEEARSLAETLAASLAILQASLSADERGSVGSC